MKKNKWLQKLKDSNLKGINSTVISIGALFLLFCIVVIFMLTIIQGKYTIEETFNSSFWLCSLPFYFSY